MTYVALTLQTCSWLLGHPQIVSALHHTLVTEDLGGLRQAEFSSGQLRMAGSADARVLAIWNREYLSGTGSEQWGLFKLDGEIGLLGEPSISQQVFERILYVISQRLQGLVIEGEFIHRTWPNGSHTCLAGRGVEARQFSIAYFEGGPGYADLSSRAIICIGPEHDFDRLQSAMDVELKNFAPGVDAANRIIDAQRRRPVLEAPAFHLLREALSPSSPADRPPTVAAVSTALTGGPSLVSPYETLHWTYSDWLEKGSLNEAQRRVLQSDGLQKHPLRIIGPAGSGKTLLMQLLAFRILEQCRSQGMSVNVLYVVHNAAMAQSVSDRFRALGAEEYLTSKEQTLLISTLSEYGRVLIGLAAEMVIDKDAHKTKLFQFEQVQEALRQALDSHPKVVAESGLLNQVAHDEQLFDIFAVLTMAEISSVIKGRGLTDDEKRYTNADVPLSRLHRILNPRERGVVFSAFRHYHQVVFEQYEMLDSDDVALSLAGRLRTPVWTLKRRTEGFDYVFVDEAQLFNENERRVFPYLTKGLTNHVPIALALDEAQEPFGFSRAGLATLGIVDAENEQLPSNHRSTRAIVELAFFVIQRTTDLFGSEFPDFTRDTGLIASEVSQSAPPTIVRCNDEAPSYAKFIVRTIQKLRARNIRQIAIVCHAETYWGELEEELTASALPIHIITQRGEKLSPDQPLVVLSRPSLIGGQEFDAVLLVGLEQGVMPPLVPDNPPLSAALEQQVLREVYLAVTRARYRVVAVLNKRASPNGILEEARQAGLLRYGQVD